MRPDWKESFLKLMDGTSVVVDEPMNKHTTFRIGGDADVFVRLNTIEELKDVLHFCHEEDVPFFLLGKGSNLLVGDKGIRGVVATFAEGLSDISFREDLMIAEAGATLAAAANAALQKGFTGLEFAAGIPGSIGGAIRMNAGAYGGEMSHIVEWVRVLAPDGEIKTLSKEEMEFGYRRSVLVRIPYIVLAAGLRLSPGDEKSIRITMMELGKKRKEKQPLEYPSAGSTFKRPEGNFAGKLITEAGLSGLRVGDAVVSPKHNGFIVNEGIATAEDVLTLIETVRKRVYEHSGILLEPEVIFVGD